MWLTSLRKMEFHWSQTALWTRSALWRDILFTATLWIILSYFAYGSSLKSRRYILLTDRQNTYAYILAQAHMQTHRALSLIASPFINALIGFNGQGWPAPLIHTGSLVCLFVFMVVCWVSQFLKDSLVRETGVEENVIKLKNWKLLVGFFGFIWRGGGVMVLSRGQV